VDDDGDGVADDGCGSWKYTYSSLDVPIETVDPLGNITTSSYNAKGMRVSSTDANRAPLGTPEVGSSQCGPRGTGNGVDDDRDGVVDDGCPAVIYLYDNADRLTDVVDAIGNVTSYGYDTNGNLTSVTNANRQPSGDPETGSQCGPAGTGNDTDDDNDGIKDDGCPSTIYTYDAVNRLQSEVDALGYVTSYQYDAASNLKQRTDARGWVTKYFPDDLNRLDRLEHWTNDVLIDSVDYSYDAVGFRTQMVDPTGTTTFTPDALGRLASVTFPGPKTVSYEYDDAPGGSAADYPGQRTKTTYPDGKTATYAFLPDGRMSSVTDWLSNQTTYSYDAAGRLTKVQYPNSVWSDFGYDTAGRLASITNNKPGPITISSFTYTHDAVGNRTQMVDMSGTHTYQYDALYRLTQVSYPGGPTDTYTYDAVGNRLTKNSTAYSYDAGDRLISAGGVSYSYDANGNQISRGSDTFAYNHENRLTQSVVGGVTSSSTYNGDGLRMSHTVGSQTTGFVWDINAGLPLVLQDGTHTNLYGLDLISATDGAGNQAYFSYDGLGSTTDITDGSASVLASYSYDAFGSIRSQTGGVSNYWLFTGEQRDADSGLYYLRARYYDPETGRFVSKDALAGNATAPQTQNRYAYALNNPVLATDPSGLSATPCAHCEQLGIPSPTFGWPPPTGDPQAFWDWLAEVVDWLYNVYFPGLQAALEAYHAFMDFIINIDEVIDDIVESISSQLDSILRFIEENADCVSFAITRGSPTCRCASRPRLRFLVCGGPLAYRGIAAA
jgi:RHS repeat-associated protein